MSWRTSESARLDKQRLAIYNRGHDLFMRTANPNAPAKINILAAARKLMMRRGYNAVSVDDICREARVTNGSFFHFFKSKDDLAKAALAAYSAERLAFFANAPFQKLKDPKARLLGWIDAATETFSRTDFPESCLLGALTQELAPVREDFREQCADCFDAGVESFARTAAQALPRAEAIRLAELFSAVAQGSMLMLKAKRDRALVRRNLLQFRDYASSLLARRR